MISTNGGALRRMRVVILAAGLSRRLGEPKALARVRGASLLVRTARTLAAVTAKDRALFIVIPPRAAGHRRELAGMHVAFFSNARHRDGLASSLRCALRAARWASHVLLLPVDLVRLERRDLLRLMASAAGRPRQVAARRIDAGRGGSPLILPRHLFGCARAARGDQGLRELLQRLPAGQLQLIPLPSATADVDTPADLTAARRNARIRSG